MLQVHTGLLIVDCTVQAGYLLPNRRIQHKMDAVTLSIYLIKEVKRNIVMRSAQLSVFDLKEISQHLHSMRHQ